MTNSMLTTVVRLMWIYVIRLQMFHSTTSALVEILYARYNLHSYTTCDNWKLYYCKIPLAMHGEVLCDLEH